MQPIIYNKWIVQTTGIIYNLIREKVLRKHVQIQFSCAHKTTLLVVVHRSVLVNN